MHGSGAPARAAPTLQQMLARVHLRLIVFAVMLAGVMLMACGLIVIRGYGERNLALIAHTVSYTVEPAILFGDTEAVRSGMVSVAGNDAVRQVEISDNGGRIIARWSRPVSGWPGAVERVIGRMIWPKPAVTHVQRGGERIAEVRVFGSAGAIGKFLLAGGAIAMFSLGISVFITRILARQLRHDVLAPLEQFAAVAHAVRRDREFGRRVSLSGILEIDRLGQDFNALLAELDSWQARVTSRNEELVRQAMHDPLTGLGNRLLFEERLAQRIRVAEIEEAPFAVLYFDVDRFKYVNDHFGHDAGDAVLREIARRMQSSLRKFDDAFRLGGDEFAAILGTAVDREQISRVIERIEQNMGLPFRLPGGDCVTSGLSVGFALYPSDGVSPQDLVRRADAEMYLSKGRSSRR